MSTLKSEEMEAIIHNSDPTFTKNGVDVYLTEHPSSEATKYVTEYVVKHAKGVDPHKVNAALAVLESKEGACACPFTVLETGSIEDDVVVTNRLNRWGILEKSDQKPTEDAEFLLGMLDKLEGESLKGLDVELGDFSDEEIRGIAQEIIDNGELAHYYQFDDSGMTVRDEVPEWAFENGDRFSYPFSIGNETFIAVDGPGYTAVAMNKMGDRQDHEGLSSRKIGPAVVHEVPEDAITLHN